MSRPMAGAWIAVTLKETGQASQGANRESTGKFSSILYRFGRRDFICLPVRARGFAEHPGKAAMMASACITAEPTVASSTPAGQDWHQTWGHTAKG